MTVCSTTVYILLLTASITLTSTSPTLDFRQMDWSTSLVHMPGSFEDEVDEDEPVEEPEIPTIGIHLGFTYSSVGVYLNGTILIMRDEHGNKMIPSYVAFTESGEVLVGQSAQRYHIDHPENTVTEAKRLIGRTWDDPEVSRFANRFPVKVVEKDDRPFFEMNSGGEEKTVSPTEICAAVISKLKEIAEDFLGTNISEAVIAVPAYFNDQQRRAIKDAGISAGLNVLRLVNEPTAAVVGYGLDRLETDGELNILVYDLGETTLDVSVLAVDNGVFEVLATAEDHHFTGNYINQPVVDYLLEEFHKTNGRVPSSDSAAVRRLRQQVEWSAKAFTVNRQVNIEIESFYDDQEFSRSLTRETFLKLTADRLRSSSANLVQRALKDSFLTKADIDYILLTGSSPHLRSTHQFLEEIFDGEKPDTRSDLDEAVARGTAEQAHAISNEDEILLCCPVMRHVGVETAGGAMQVLIGKNTFSPAEAWGMFTTAKDNQSTVSIKIFEGERPVARDNFFIGHFNLTGLSPAPCGVPRINITVSLDINDIVGATATDLHSGKMVSFRADEDAHFPCAYRRVEDEAKAAVGVDKLEKRQLRAMNSLQGYVYTLNGELKGGGAGLGGVSPEEKAALSQAVDAALEWLSDNRDAEKEDFDTLKRELGGIAEPILSASKRPKSENDAGSKEEL